MSQKELGRITDRVLAYDPSKKDRPALAVIAGTPDRPLDINGVEIQCYVLEDETRVLSQRGLQSSIGLGTGGGTRRGGAPRMVEFVESIEGKGIDIKGLAVRLRSAIEFQPPGGGRTAIGNPAVLLTDICRVVLSARRAGILMPRQAHIAQRCELLMEGLAEVGIIALVDEATGYQEIREQRALATILEKFIAKELQPWTKTFPFSFYEQICKLKGWPNVYSVKRPSVIGKYTNDFVYQRLAPGILEELRRLNPVRPSGYRSAKFHQWFTPDLGHPKLLQHLAGVEAIMRVATSWDDFKRKMDIAYPRENATIPMNIDS